MHRGIATLTGVVNSFAEREAAEEAALGVSGIHDVADDVQVNVVGHPAHSDADIALAARHALEWEPLIPSDRIKTCVSNGIVTLYGTVDSWQQAAAAESAVGDLEGVRDIDSELAIAAPAHPV